MLGVLKAGKPFAALDPTYPVSRKRYIVGETDSPLVLAEPEVRLADPLVQLDEDAPAQRVVDRFAFPHHHEKRLAPPLRQPTVVVSPSPGRSRTAPTTHGCTLDPVGCGPLRPPDGGAAWNL